MSAKELLMEAEFMRDMEVASAVVEAVVKFKESGSSLLSSKRTTIMATMSG